MNQQPKQDASAERLFCETAEGPALVGSRCTSCGTTWFPKLSACNNPRCNQGKVQEVMFGRCGKLHSYTIQYYKPPPPFQVAEPFSPYAIGLVELQEGIRVPGIIMTNRLEDLKAGIDVKLVLDILYQDDKGNQVVTWKFKPI